MSSEPIRNDHISEMRRKYLRWSIPSIILAIISVCFGIASMLTQPWIRNRYQAIAQAYLGESNDGDSQWTEHEMRRAEIAAKRLLVENPQSADAAMTVARVGLASQSRLMRQWSTHLNETTGAAISDWVELAISNKQKTTASMQRAARLDGPAALEARLWILDGQFRENAAKSGESLEHLQSLQSDAEQLIDSGAGAKQLLADLMIHRALLFAQDSNPADGETWAQQARELLESSPASSLRDASGLELTSIRDPLQAKRLAVSIISQRAGSSQSDWATWREPEAMFRMRLHLGNLEEAFDFAWTNLGQLPVIERDIFRWNAAASALRSMVVHLSQSEPLSAKQASLLFGFAIRFAPDSGNVASIVHAMLREPLSARAIALEQSIAQGADPSLKDWLLWMRSVVQPGSLTSPVSPPADASIDIHFAPASLLVVRNLRTQDERDDQQLMLCLDSMATVFKTHIEVHLMRSELAMRLHDFKKAIESLSLLQERFPGEPKIASALREAQTRLQNNSNASSSDATDSR